MPNQTHYNFNPNSNGGNNILNTVSDAGVEIMDAVTAAINRGDYSHLSADITKTVSGLTGTIQSELKNQAQAMNSLNQNQARYGSGIPRGAGTSAMPTYSNHAQMRYSSQTSPFMRRKVSSVNGVGKLLGGIFGVSFNALFALSGVIGGLAGGEPFSALFSLAFFGILTVGFGVMWKKGSDEKKLSQRYLEYGRAVGQAEYFDIDDLAIRMGLAPQTVRDEIKKMMEAGFLPTAQFDATESTVMLTQESYQQYLNAEMGRREREAKEREIRKAENVDGLPEDVRQILVEGNDYLKTVRRLNEAIPGQEMTSKLYELEGIMNKIFTQVKKEPSSAQNLRKFMNYYLPTTIKLLTAYAELDRQPDDLENVRTTKTQIEESMDTINQAFEQLLDSMFQDMAWDVATDLNVMRTMMQQDGLTGQDLRAGQTAQSVGGAQVQTAPAGSAVAAGGAAMQMPGADAQGQYQTELKF